MSGLRLVRIAPLGVPGEWPVPTDRRWVLGRSHPRSSAPDIDLWPDQALSRQHAAVWFETGRYWIQDLGSTAGTVVEDEPLAPGVPAPLEAGMVVAMGETRLLVLAPGAHALRVGSACLELGPTIPLGYSLAQRGWVPFDRMVLHAMGPRPSPAQRLDLALGPYAAVSAALPAIPPASRRALAPTDVRIDLQALSLLGERRWVPWRIERAGQALAADTALGSWVLPANELVFVPRHRISLAAFIQPNHPRVVRIASEAGFGHGPGAAPADVLRAIYEHLRSSWFLTYRQEPPSFGSDAQRVRLAHDLLTDLHQRTGHGTCLDLALLIAGVGESLGIQPLVAVLDLGSTHHALVGCWRQRGPRLDPLPNTPRTLADNAAWVDPNGCTRDGAQQRGFDQSQREALRMLQEAPFLFAVDIAAARQEGVVPLPTTGEPQWDPVTSRVVASANQFAHATEAGLSLVSLLAGMLEVAGSAVRAAFTSRLGDPDGAVEHLRSRRTAPHSAGSDRKAHAVLAAAQVAARVERSALVVERHLLAAFFDMPSRSVDEALQMLGTDRGTLRTIIAEDHPELASSPTDLSTVPRP